MCLPLRCSVPVVTHRFGTNAVNGSIWALQKTKPLLSTDYFRTNVTKCQMQDKHFKWTVLHSSLSLSEKDPTVWEDCFWQVIETIVLHTSFPSDRTKICMCECEIYTQLDYKWGHKIIIQTFVCLSVNLTTTSNSNLNSTNTVADPGFSRGWGANPYDEF